MRGVKFYLPLICGVLMAGSVWAADENNGAAETEETGVDVQKELVSQPVIVKKIYREAWKNDNNSKLGTIEQLEYYQKNSPDLDDDTKVIMRNGIELMKRMNFGLENKDIVENAADIQKDPAKAAQDLSEGVEIDISPAELLSIAEEIRGPSERLMDKVFHDKSLGKVTYPLDVDSF